MSELLRETVGGDKLADNSMTRKIGGASIGNFGEIYDFAIFRLSVPILAIRFFPRSDQTAALLSTFAVYAVAFFARPLGGLIFGFMADEFGRIKVMAITIWLMAAGTAAIGLLPTYGSVGIAAPILLVVCRIAQGLAMGGETTGSTSYILESAPDDRRGQWVGIIWFFAHVPNALVGVILSGLQMASGPAAYADWVWRVPFLAGGLIGIVGFWLRRRLAEPEEFREASHSDNPLLALGHSGLKCMLYVVLIQPVQTVGSYLLVGFMYTFLVRVAELKPTPALLSNAAAMMVIASCILLGGMLSDRFGRKRILSAGAACIALTAYPAVHLAASGTLANALLGQALVAAGVGLYGGAAFTAVAELFPTSFRATGHAISYQLTVAVFGGTTPFISTWLVGAFRSPLAPGFYVMLIAVAGLIAVQFVPETRGVRLRTGVYQREPGRLEVWKLA